MTLAEFAAKYSGKKVDFDKEYGAQCVDLFRQYCQDVIGCPHTGSVEGARDLWFNFSDNDEKLYFDRFSPWFVQPGDVAIWDETASNKYGHVAIVLLVDNKAKELLVLEQNGFAQDGVKLAVRGWSNLIGVLRKRA